MTQKVEYGSEGSPLQRVEYGPDDGMVIHGSSLMGTYLTRYDTLVEYFGEPNCPPGDKTWNNWDLCFRVYDEDGEDSEDVYVSIYDWKESNPEIVWDGALGRVVKTHQQMVEFSRRYSAVKLISSGSHKIRGNIVFRACNNKVCNLPKKISYGAKIDVLSDKN